MEIRLKNAFRSNSIKVTPRIDKNTIKTALKIRNFDISLVSRKQISILTNSRQN